MQQAELNCWPRLNGFVLVDSVELDEGGQYFSSAVFAQPASLLSGAP